MKAHITTPLQNHLLKLLFEIDDLCRANDIQYMLFAGAQLGVDRHGGLIPWDDDIDIIMTLDHYDRFLDITHKDLPPDRAFNALEKSSDYILTYGRYVDIHTAALQRHTVFGGLDPGVKIDVFFAVPTSDDIELAERHRLQILAFSELVTDCAVMKYRRPDGFFPFYYEEKKLHEKMGRKEYIAARLPELKYRYAAPGGTPKRYVLFSGMMSDSYLFDADKIENAQDTFVFGHPVMAAADGKYFNELLYGESWYQIPSNYKKPRHSWGIDLSQSYKEYLPLLQKRVDLPAVRKTAAARKEYGLEQQYRYRDCLIERASLNNLAAGLSADRTVSDGTDTSGSIDYKSICEELQPFYTAQLGRDTVWYRLAVPVSADTASAAIEGLLWQSDYPKARKAAALQKLHGQLDEPGAERLARQADYCRAMTEAVYLNDAEDTESFAETISRIINSDDGKAFPTYCNSVLGSAPDTRITAEAGGRLLLHRAEDAAGLSEKEQLLKELLRYADDAMARYGNSGELIALKVLALHGLHVTGDEYDSALQAAVENITNGFVLQELLDLGADLGTSETAPSDLCDDDEILAQILRCVNRQGAFPVFPGKTICGAVYASDGRFLEKLSLPEAARIELLVADADCDQLAKLLAGGMPDYDIKIRQNKSGRFIAVSDPRRLGTTINAIINKQTRLLPYRVLIRTFDGSIPKGGSIAYKDAGLDLPADEALWLSCMGIEERPVGKPVPSYPVYAGNVAADDYLGAANESGLLSPEKVSLYKEYRERRKNEWVKPTSVINSLYNEILDVCHTAERE